MSIPYFPMYVVDFEADTTHLTTEEDGAYNRLLRLCWRTPGCTLPDDEVWIRRRVRASEEEFERAYRPVIDEYFIKENQRVFSLRLLDEFEKLSDKFERLQNNGKLGGRPPQKTKLLKSNDPDLTKRLPSGSENKTKTKPKGGDNQNQNQNQNQNIKEEHSLRSCLSEIKISDENDLGKPENQPDGNPVDQKSDPPEPKPIHPEENDEAFGAFWAVYPKARAGSKSKALSAYRAAKKRHLDNPLTDTDLLAAAQSYAASDEVKRGYAKGCAAWLNDDRFYVDYGQPPPQLPSATGPKGSQVEQLKQAFERYADEHPEHFH